MNIFVFICSFIWIYKSIFLQVISLKKNFLTLLFSVYLVVDSVWTKEVHYLRINVLRFVLKLTAYFETWCTIQGIFTFIAWFSSLITILFLVLLSVPWWWTTEVVFNADIIAVSSIHIFQCMDNIKTTKNKLKIQHGSSVYSIMYVKHCQCLLSVRLKSTSQLQHFYSQLTVISIENMYCCLYALPCCLWNTWLSGWGGGVWCSWYGVWLAVESVCCVL